MFQRCDKYYRWTHSVKLGYATFCAFVNWYLLNLECNIFALDDMNQGCQIIFSSRKSHLGKFWKVLQLKIFYDQFVYIKVKWYSLHMSIWYILWSFGIFFPVWYTYCTAKNLATLIWMTKEEQSTILWLLHCIQIARFFLLQNI
jgi:hypothetical protein